MVESRTWAFGPFPWSLVRGLGATACWGGGIAALCAAPNGGDEGPDRAAAVCCGRDAGGLSPAGRLAGPAAAAAAVIWADACSESALEGGGMLLGWGLLIAIPLGVAG